MFVIEMDIHSSYISSKMCLEKKKKSFTLTLNPLKYVEAIEPLNLLNYVEAIEPLNLLKYVEEIEHLCVL